jgi:hypothetical protein
MLLLWLRLWHSFLNWPLYSLLQGVNFMHVFGYLEFCYFEVSICKLSDVTVCTVPEVCNRGVCSSGRWGALPSARLWHGHHYWARVSKDHMYQWLRCECSCSLSCTPWMLQWWCCYCCEGGRLCLYGTADANEPYSDGVFSARSA